LSLYKEKAGRPCTAAVPSTVPHIKEANYRAASAFREKATIYKITKLSNFLSPCVPIIKKNEMGGACSTYGKQESCMKDFGGET
jgi:hypothetical protein